MPFSSGECRYATQVTRTVKTTHLHRRGSHRHRAVAQPAIRIVTPRPHRAIGLHDYRMIESGFDHRHTVQSGDQHRGRGRTGGRRSIPQLPDVVTAPGPHRAITLQRHAEVFTGTHCNHAA